MNYDVVDWLLVMFMLTALATSTILISYVWVVV